MHNFFQKLFETLNEDSESLIDISEDFVVQINEYIIIIRNAIDSNDYEKLNKSIHTLKGSVLNFDIPVILDQLSEIKFLVLQNKKTEALKALEKIQEEMEIFQNQLKSLKIK